MTLNIILANSRAVHVGADFRLTNADTGEVITERSPKVLVIREANWGAVLTYTGIGRWRGRDTSDWLRSWLLHGPESERSFEETAGIIESEGNRWLSNMRRGYPHSFVLAGVIRGRSKVALISNRDRLHSQSGALSNTLSTEVVSPRALVLVTGIAGAVPVAVKRLLASAIRRGDDVSQLQRLIGREIASAAQSKASNGAISSSSFVYSILGDGQGQGHLHGAVGGALEVITLTNGLDPLSLIRSLLGPNAQVIPTAHATINPDSPTVAEACEPELENSLDRDGAVSGYQIHELAHMGSGHARAAAINSRGLVVGQSGRTRHGAPIACLWRTDGVPMEVIPNARSSWAVGVNDNEDIAGTLQLQDGGNRTFLATPANLVVGKTLGGFHSNAQALNNRGEVAGSSWSIPGNTPGDKRERAFKWVPGNDLQDLGALREDWCSRSVAINDHGTVVGQSHPRDFGGGPNRGFIFNPSDGLADLGVLDGTSAAPVDINNREEVVGLASRHGQPLSFIWTRHGGMRALPLPAGSSVRAINDNGLIVYTRETPGGARAFVWRDAQEIALPCFRGHQSEAAAINNAGEIVGHVWRGNHGHAVKWSPVLR